MIYIRSPYQHKRTQKITGIVIHTTAGAYNGTINWFQKNPNSVSAHYVVKENGSEVTQMVKDDYVSYHAGIVSKPTTPVYKGGNPNEYTLGIENADNGDPHGLNRTAQYKTLIKLVHDLCKKHNLPIDSNYICGHKQIRSTKTCPGNIDVNYVINEAKKLQGESMPDCLVPNTPEWQKKYMELVEKSSKYDSFVKAGYENAEKMLNKFEELRNEAKAANDARKQAEEAAEISRKELKDFIATLADDQHLKTRQDKAEIVSVASRYGVLMGNYEDISIKYQNDKDLWGKTKAELESEIARLKAMLDYEDVLSNATLEELIRALVKKLTTILRFK